MPDVASTSIDAERLGPGRPRPAPTTASVEQAARFFGPAFADAIGATLTWPEA
jgi:hypothetical protein